VVVLCDLEFASYDDAARILECPVGTVRSRLNRGRALLKEKLMDKVIAKPALGGAR
jgi:RNA polymerase sigma-70 factor (ECF subfamily)